jgi:alkanesulfonate monooxygenase SsuD/methylene tetrahydromethanopterin reductase-like flavin-dependent oxidoreductase (luciferase family)
VRVGVLILPAAPWRESARWWRMADELGFAHAWVHDHLAWRDLPNGTWFAAVPTLAAAAGVTSKVLLGTLVCTPNYRHPVTLAKEAIALDDLSNGRMVLGLGAGGDGFDAQVLGQPRQDRTSRVSRFAEFTDLIDRLLQQEITDFDGAYYQARQARMVPGCRQRPRMPLAVAAPSSRSMQVAARFADIWVTNGVTPEPGRRAAVVDVSIVRAQVEQFREACLAAGRGPEEPARLVYHANRDRSALASVAEFSDLAGAYAEVGVSDLVVPFPRTEPPHMAGLAVLERVASDVLPDLQGLRQ